MERVLHTTMWEKPRRELRNLLPIGVSFDWSIQGQLLLKKLGLMEIVTLIMSGLTVLVFLTPNLLAKFCKELIVRVTRGGE